MPDRAGADQRAVVAEPGGRDARRGAVPDARDGVDLLLGGIEERRREPERDVATDDDQVEIERGADRARRASDEPPGAAHDVVRRLASAGGR